MSVQLLGPRPAAVRSDADEAVRRDVSALRGNARGGVCVCVFLLQKSSVLDVITF